MAGRHWYVVHTYSGYENKVKESLISKAESLGMTDRIFRAEIPMESVIEEKKGKRVVVQKKLYPGYVLVDMIVENDTWYVVRNTPGVTGFVGSEKTPVPLSDAEAMQLMHQMGIDDGKRVDIKVRPGQNVRIREGTLADFVGKVEDVNESRGTVTVLVDMFGRETKAEVDYFQIDEIE